MKRIAQVSSSDDFYLEMQREALRDRTLRRWAKGVALVLVSAAFAADALVHLPALLSCLWWFWRL